MFAVMFWHDCQLASVVVWSAVVMRSDGLTACVFSGGASERMGRDKALLSHPSGGLWLPTLVDHLRALQLPVLVVSRHQSHQALLHGRPQVQVMLESPPWQGPLRALERVLAVDSGYPLLVAPVDMPLLTPAVLQQLIDDWQTDPQRVAVADDGERLQPLLGIYPSGAPFQPLLRQQLQQGDRRWLRWLDRIPHQTVRLPAAALRNVNAPADLAALQA